LRDQLKKTGGFAMRYTALFAVSIGGLLASSSFGALVVEVTRGTSANAPGFDVVYVRARNNSGPTAVQAQSITYTTYHPLSMPTGPDALQFPDGDEFGGVGTGASATAIASRSAPSGTYAFIPSATNVATTPGRPTDYSTPWRAFSAQSFRTSSAFSTTAAAGLIIGAAVVPAHQSLWISGSLNPTLDAANSVDIGYIYSHVDPFPPEPPIIVSNTGASVVFGPVTSTPLPFSGTVTVASPDAGTSLSLQLGMLPANVSGVTITPSGLNPNGTVFTVSGLISYVGNGATYLPIIAADDDFITPDTTGVFVVTVTPEPASLSFGSGVLLLRRKRR
jgi:hypothetical protein